MYFYLYVNICGWLCIHRWLWGEWCRLIFWRIKTIQIFFVCWFIHCNWYDAKDKLQYNFYKDQMQYQRMRQNFKDQQHKLANFATTSTYFFVSIVLYVYICYRHVIQAITSYISLQQATNSSCSSIRPHVPVTFASYFRYILFQLYSSSNTCTYRPVTVILSYLTL